MLLLTGATGTIGGPLLRRLTAAGVPVRCLVRDPRRLGAERVRVQIAMGRVEDHASFRHALRDVSAVIHLATPARDQPGASIEELVGIGTWRLVRAAERAGVDRFYFCSALGAGPRAGSRLLRAKALAEEVVAESAIAHTVFAPSLVYAPGDAYLRQLRRLSLLPVVPIAGRGRALAQPIWADDVAAAIFQALPGGDGFAATNGARVELAGPETMSERGFVEHVLRSLHHARPIVPVPRRLIGRRLTAGWDATALSAHGSAEVEALGVSPRRVAAVLGG